MPTYPRSIYGTQDRSHSSAAIFASVMVLFMAIIAFVSGGRLWGALYLAASAALMVWAERADRDRRRREKVYLDGVEVEAQILARYEAGALQGSELAKARQMMESSHDNLELEVRYTFSGREIVSRASVPVDLFFRSRGMTTLKIKILPDDPENWIPLG